MTPISNRIFQTNPNKDYLRAVYDRGFIEDWYRVVGTPLHYLGLPGPELLDIVEWQDMLGNVTTIERGDDQQHLMFLRANVRDIEHRLYALHGEFDQILLTGRDSYGHSPQWPYDVVNLDFYGGLLYSDLSRPRAIGRLIANQSNHQRSFLLIVSYHLRDGDFTGEKLAYLDDLERKLRQDVGKRADVVGFIDWHRSSTTPDAARQVLYLNALLHDEGEAAHFKVSCHPASVYAGTGGARMIHFVTTFEHQRGSHRVVSDQSLLDIVNLGYEELADGVFTPKADLPRIRS